MIRRAVVSLVVPIVLLLAAATSVQAQERAYGQVWGSAYANQNWSRFYHYPYVYYPHNFWGQQYFRSAPNLYYRYPTEMRIPVYNKSWHNPYPAGRRYHSGHQFILDVF